MMSFPHLLREAERTLEQRRGTYPRLVVEGRMSAAQATLRLDQQEAIVDALYVLESEGASSLLRAIQKRIDERMERRRALNAPGTMPAVNPRFKIGEKR